MKAKGVEGCTHCAMGKDITASCHILEDWLFQISTAETTKIHNVTVSISNLLTVEQRKEENR
jgi:hypothetical protein